MAYKSKKKKKGKKRGTFIAQSLLYYSLAIAYVKKNVLV